MNGLYFHWYNNPDESLIEINKAGCKKLFKHIKKYFLTYKELERKTGVKNDTLSYHLKKIGVIRVKTLKKLLKAVKIKYNKYDKFIVGISRHRIRLKIKFPTNLNNTNSIILIAAFLSDGHNSKDHPHYANVGFLGNKKY